MSRLNRSAAYRLECSAVHSWQSPLGVKATSFSTSRIVFPQAVSRQYSSVYLVSTLEICLIYDDVICPFLKASDKSMGMTLFLRKKRVGPLFQREILYYPCGALWHLCTLSRCGTTGRGSNRRLSRRSSTAPSRLRRVSISGWDSPS